jgi:hypothetical protein
LARNNGAELAQRYGRGFSNNVCPGISTAVEPDRRNFFPVWGKTPGLDLFSTGSAQAAWKELTHADRIEPLP